MKNSLILLLLLWLAEACNTSASGPSRDTTITSTARQQELAVELSGIVADSLLSKDTLAVMILPFAASCPSCRDKTIDSIMAFRGNIPENHYIVFSIDGGRKSIRGYFRSAGHQGIPDIPGVLIYDSTDVAGSRKLYRENPAFFYLSKGKVVRKIDALPHTVREDLREFFRGYRLNEK